MRLTYKNALFVIVIISILLFSITNKTPNFGWMGTYTAPNFPELTTGLPVFKPWIVLEKINFNLLGNFWIVENLAYSLFAAALIFIFYINANKNKKRFLAILHAIPLFSIIFFAAWGGPIYDILFCLALIITLDILVSINNNSSKRTVIVLAFWLSILDLSRPFGYVFLVVSMLWVAYKLILPKFILFIILVAIIVVPFHIIQFLKYETFSLTTYKGQNLAEVFPYSQRNCFEKFGRKKLDTLEFSRCSNQMYSDITNIIKGDPRKIFEAFNLNRVITILIPAPFWHGTGLKVSSVLIRSIEYLFYMILITIYIVALYNFKFNTRYLLGSLYFLIGTFIVVVTHSGTEAIRVFMPFLCIVIWLPLGCETSKSSGLEKINYS